MTGNRLRETTEPTAKRAGRRYAVIVANSPGPRKHSYEEFLEKYRALKAAGKIMGSRIKVEAETGPAISSTPMRGQFTAEEISRAINKVKGRQRS
jgi:hypothetical protein